ncbi:uncharacterized protein LOC132407142 isoform X2 [Hypanus sabinus]|uniref:uncharacterized protein LOC132407142 isoform X2 n=1 Tax=Hypanus sabinus TaxID=79690 RepID=UPI0028C3D1B4|nr:uncharacterized protein LOC132407142 isoform X2 [Hypanus sabinus]
MYFFAALGGNQLVGIIFTTVSLITADEVFQVIQTPQRTSLTVGENAIFSCTISSSEDTSNVNIYWWKLGEVNLIQPDSRKHIDSGEEKGSLQLLNISIADSGVYHCGIKFRGVDVANGSGSQLIVSGVTIVWYKNNKTISNGINTTQRLNNAGMYEASSTLHDAQLAQSGSVYTCLASHVTLKIPAMAIYLVPNFNPDRDAWTSTNFYLKVFGSTGFALTLFLLMVITRIPFRFISCRDR